MSANPKEYTAESDRMAVLEAERDALRDALHETMTELKQARKRVKWFSTLVARLCKADLDRKAALYGKSNRRLDKSGSPGGSPVGNLGNPDLD